MYWSEFLTVALIHLLAVASPGPDFAIVVRESVGYGRRAGLFTAFGVGTGILVHVTYSLLGIGLIVSQSIVLFNALKWLAAAYLLYIGIKALRAMILVDMIGDRDLQIRRETNSTTWLTETIWAAAKRVGHGGTFIDAPTAIEDDHLPFLRAGVPSVDIIDLDYTAWHHEQECCDDLSRVSARSLQIVGEVVLAALPDIEKRLLRQ